MTDSQTPSPRNRPEYTAEQITVRERVFGDAVLVMLDAFSHCDPRKPSTVDAYERAMVAVRVIHSGILSALSTAERDVKRLTLQVTETKAANDELNTALAKEAADVDTLRSRLESAERERDELRNIERVAVDLHTVTIDCGDLSEEAQDARWVFFRVMKAHEMSKAKGEVT